MKHTVDGIRLVLDELIYPNAKSMNGANFRRYFCYNVKTDTILKKNDENLKKVYISNTHAKKRYWELADCKKYVLKVGVKCSDMMVGAIYAESMMTIIDTIRDPTRPQQMKYVEFLVFLCRIAHEHYKDTVYAKELLYKKLDHLMPSMLAPLYLQPQFLFGEKFAIDQEKDRKLH